MCCNYPCQIGALTSESFSECMISAANLLVETHRISLVHDFIGNLIVLRMSKRFMESVTHKDAFTSIVFHDVFSDEHPSANKKWNYQIFICYHCYHTALCYIMQFFVSVNIILIYSFRLILIFKIIYCTLFYVQSNFNPINVFPKVL